ncbi:MAG: DUF6364 family protein [Puniceicoccaceae bacterium]
MQSKLTLRMEDAVIRKAKRLAKQKGQSVSKFISKFISAQPEDADLEELPPGTASMVGVLGRDTDEKAYKDHLEDKYL